MQILKSYLSPLDLNLNKISYYSNKIEYLKNKKFKNKYLTVEIIKIIQSIQNVT